MEFGINTVHMQLEKALGDSKKQDQYFSNVALKVNTKLGGINHLVRIFLLSLSSAHEPPFIYSWMMVLCDG